ncbi:molybdopterin-guanine dinucleotide biosynthesis protein B [Candidatus Hodarchaeum mangrovi]
MDLRTLGIVGSRNSGKTTAIIELSNILTQYNLKFAIIKFMHHRYDFDLDKKDSKIFKVTNAKIIISASPFETVIYKPQKSRTNLKILKEFLPSDLEILLCESYPADESEKIPLIYSCFDKDDYLSTKIRYFNQKPLFITGKIADSTLNSLDNLPILSFSKQSDIKTILEILNLQK